MRAFYENLTSRFDAEQANSGFFGGMITNLVGMLREGLPLEVDQTTTSSIMGRTSVAGRSINIVTSARPYDFNPAWCGQSIAPPGYAVQDIDQQISDALSGASSTGGVDSGEMAAAMQEYQAAMDNLTPEQRAMLEQMGMGDRLAQMSAGAGAGGMSGAPMNAPAPGGAATASAATAQAATSSGAASAQLMGSSIEESVSNHLGALGYDVGSGDDTALYTAVAISQYQAERGMPVTGESSAELLDALAAEVDGSR